jgi:uncharacterized membrane protein YkgB
MKADQLLNNVLDHSDWIARIALAIVFGWFGILKLLGLSPVSDLIIPLFERLAPFMTPSIMVVLGIGEIILAIGFLIPKLTKVVVAITILHLLGTFLTLIFTPDLTWTSFLVPTFAGEFVIKNVVLIALGLNILQNYRLKQGLST